MKNNVLEIPTCPLVEMEIKKTPLLASLVIVSVLP